ncbi:F-box only protein 36 [Melipona quadrifasciata]|uniref:F-box only protein 36 n=1 Tax=Melipona quadrifasciata TaxID=166423 RepID=A0A0M8ZYD1_9HYME|nr:F-box only protein 36 [Melipona quadrifasciata]
MSGKLEYLEKYSVAPSPSRDYYGLRVVDDQVTLYHWRISHGPHKTPIVRTSSFVDFKQDHPLQDEIRRIFGEYLLKHIRNITSGKNTLLTLPRCLINKLIKYLTVQDVVILRSLSRVSKEIFDDNHVWETLYKKYSPITRNKYEELRITCNWKQLFQLAKIQELTHDQKMFRARGNAKQRSTNPKIDNLTKGNLKLENMAKATSKIENSMKLSGSSTKIASKNVPPENGQFTKKPEVPRKKNTQNFVSRKLPDNRPNETTIDREKIISEKKTSAIKSLQIAGQKNIKAMKDHTVAAKTDTRDPIANKVAETKSNKPQNKVKRIDTKASNASLRTAEDKSSNVKSKNSVTPKVNKPEKSTRSIQSDQAKPKPKGKAKKIGHSKSTILSTSTDLLNDHSPIKDDSFDLADLIQASLKNIRSPRSMFDYSFSCIEKTKSCAGDTTVSQEISRKMADHPRALKGTLDRLSEKSEPLTAKSIDSGDKSELSHGSLTPKYLKLLNSELKKSTELNKNRNVAIPEEKVDHGERYGVCNKYPTPRILDKELKKSTPQKEIDKMSMLRALGTRSLLGKNVGSNSMDEINRYELKKTVNNVYKY